MKNCSQVKTLRGKNLIETWEKWDPLQSVLYFGWVYFIHNDQWILLPTLTASALCISWCTVNTFTHSTCLSAPSCVRQRSSHSVTRPTSSTTSTVRWWVCLWTLTSPIWRGSTLHARYRLIPHLFSMSVVYAISLWIWQCNDSTTFNGHKVQSCHLLIWAIICNVLRLTLLAAATVQMLIWQVLFSDWRFGQHPHPPPVWPQQADLQRLWGAAGESRHRTQVGVINVVIGQ